MTIIFVNFSSYLHVTEELEGNVVYMRQSVQEWTK